MLLTGKCHCGNIALELDWEGDPPRVPARVCGCSFCVKHGGVWTSNPKARLRIAIREPSHVTRYAFATRSARFHVCAQCGIVPVVTCELEGRTYAVVSVNALENVEPAWLDRGPISFEGEDLEGRLARRKRNWIADVRVTERR